LIDQRSARCNNLKRPAARLAAVAAAGSTPTQHYSESPPPKKRLAVFVSGGGSNFRAIHAATQQGAINGEVAVVVSNAPSCGGCQYARQQGIPTLTYPAPKDDPSAGLSADELVEQLTQVRQRPALSASITLADRALCLPSVQAGRRKMPDANRSVEADMLQELSVDIVALAGYLKLVPQQLVRAYKRRILNIHPALLPAFGGKGYYGAKVIASFDVCFSPSAFMILSVSEAGA
jgi:phosphoribosylglycinamide formyltransferase